MANKLKGNELKAFCIFTMLLLFASSFILNSPAEIAEGMITIVLSRDVKEVSY